MISVNIVFISVIGIIRIIVRDLWVREKGINYEWGIFVFEDKVKNNVEVRKERVYIFVKMIVYL